MNRTDTHNLLTFIARFDNRRFDDATVLAWHPVLHDLELPDCQRAVAAHFAESDAYLMPAHIRRRVADLARERKRVEREAKERREIAAYAETSGPLTDRSAEIQAFVGQIRGALPESDRKALVPRAVAWEREHTAYVRQQTGEPNPDYDPSMRPVPEWNRSSDKAAGPWWTDERARERHAKEMLAEAGRLAGRKPAHEAS